MTVGTVNASFPAGTDMDQFDVGLLAVGTFSAESGTSYKVTIGSEALIMGGTGFTFNGAGVPTGGTVTSIEDQYQGAVNFDLTNFSLSAVTLQALANADNNPLLMTDLFTGHDTLIGGPNGDLLRSFGGHDSIIGGAGNDTIYGGTGNDTIDGGAGQNTINLSGANNDIIVRQGLSNLATPAFDTLNGWSSTDVLTFAHGPTGASDIAKITAANYAAALSAANALIAAGTDNIVVTQVGSDLYVFADSANDNGTADDVVMITGHVLTDLSASNFTLSPAPPPPVSPPPVSPPPVSPPPVSPPPVSPPPVSPPPVSPPPVSPPPVSPPPVSPPPAPSGGSSGSPSTGGSTTLTPAAFVTDSSSILRLGASSPAATSALASLSAQLSTGAITAAAAVKGAIALAGGTTSVATMSYEFFTGSAPSGAGIDYLVSPTSSNPNNLNSAYFQGFSVENRYINFAVSLGKAGAGGANFQAQYGSLSLTDATTQAYSTIFGSAPIAGKVDTLLSAMVTSNGVTETRAQYFAQFGQDGLNGIGTKAAMVGWLLAQAQSADVGTYAQSNDAFLTDVAVHGASFGADIIGAYAKPGFAYVAPATPAAPSGGSSGSASTLNLTPTAFVADTSSILRLSVSSPEATATLATLTTQLTSGAITADAALKGAIALAGGTTSVATMSYEFFTGSAPSAAGIDYLVSPTSSNLNNLNSSYYQGFSVENRYINFAVSLGTASAGAANFQAQYGSLSLADATTQAYMTIFGSVPTAAKVDTLLNTMVTSNGVTETRAQYFAEFGHDGLTGIGTKAAMVGWLLAQAQSADVGTYAQSNDAFLTDVALHNASFGVDIIGAYAQPGFVFHPG